MRKERMWGVFMREDKSPCFTWDKKHPENKRKKETVRVYAIYPRKEDALTDAQFRGESYVEEIRGLLY